MTVMRMMKRAAVVLAGSVALVLLGTTQAQAAVTWLWERAGGNNIGTASYTDSGNVIKVDDQEVNDKSLLLFVHRPGVSNGYACWDHGGADGPGTTCNLSQYDENTLLEGYLCQGEWASNPANRVIYWGGCDKAHAKTFRK
ncbi:hypothetical protein [Kribbella sp. CA-247076]|uniref:hypothetical protein n=1 Tax=Kribbella sp. CA-247076 TaxID=3239941 RepID=UPI003D949568